MELITSKNNPRVMHASKLLKKKYREEYGEYLVVGRKLTAEASFCGIYAKTIFVTKNFLDKNEEFCRDIFEKIGQSAEIILTDDEILKKISGDESPDGIVCIMGCIDKSEKIDKIYNNTLCDGIKGGVIILDSVRDPGNMGTVIRTAYAFGTGLIIASPDCADVYSPKVQRGAMGAAFSQSLITKPTADAVKELRENGFSVYAAALHHNSLDIRDVKMNEKTAFVIGNEGNGLSEEIIDLCTGSVIIPIQEHSESLNAAVASAVIMWEMAKPNNR